MLGVLVRDKVSSLPQAPPQGMTRIERRDRRTTGARRADVRRIHTGAENGPHEAHVAAQRRRVLHTGTMMKSVCHGLAHPWFAGEPDVLAGTRSRRAEPSGEDAEDFATLDEVAGETRVYKAVAAFRLLSCWLHANSKERGDRRLEAGIVAAVRAVIVATISKLALRTIDTLKRLAEKQLVLVHSPRNTCDQHFAATRSAACVLDP